MLKNFTTDHLLKVIGELYVNGSDATDQIRQLRTETERLEKIIKPATGQVERMAEELALLKDMRIRDDKVITKLAEDLAAANLRAEHFEKRCEIPQSTATLVARS